MIGVCAESSCRYHSSLTFPEAVEGGLRVAHLGRSSVRYEIALFKQGMEHPAATGSFVHVFVDRAQRRPAEIPLRCERRCARCWSSRGVTTVHGSTRCLDETGVDVRVLGEIGVDRAGVAEDEQPAVDRIADGAGHHDRPGLVVLGDRRQVTGAVRAAALDDVGDVLVDQELQRLGHGANGTVVGRRSAAISASTAAACCSRSSAAW